MQPMNDPNPSASAGDAIKPYLTPDGSHFDRDFYVEGRLAAMAGALVNDYVNALVILGRSGFFGDASDGRRPAHTFVVGPDDPSKPWNEVMTTPGTIGWNPLGAEYRYNYTVPHRLNFAAWVQAGAPKENQYGEWANNGLPLEYVEWTWENPSTRGPSPLSGYRKRRHNW